ncbi:MAG: HAMP domain-containing sensor histidine kinase [Deltaproteobacteria bacterium]|jgi:signal transduction histidine kinase
MSTWSVLPIWIVDLVGAVGMIVFSGLCLLLAEGIYRRDPEHPLANYLLWFSGAIFAFSLSRSIGHIVRHFLQLAGHGYQWQYLAPISGSINSITFVVIASVTLFFHRMQTIMNRMARDRQRIEKTSQELLRLNRDMEAIVSERTRSEMALRVAHGVRNPAIIISGLVKRIAKDLEECGAGQKYFKKVQEETKKLESLVEKLESVQPGHQLHFSPQELNGLVEETLEIVQPEADDKGVALLLDRASAALTFQGNPHLVKMAILHVLRNAIEACSHGDTIQVSTALVSRGVIVIIKDNGPGIPREVLEHVFEPFYSTKKGETGLGLAHVRQIIEEHLGSVEINSREGEGTEVVIILPTHLGELEEQTGHEKPGQSQID